MCMLTLGMGICVLHDLGELFIHAFNQRQNAATYTEWLGAEKRKTQMDEQK